CSFDLNVGLPGTTGGVITEDSGNMTVHDVPGRLTLRSLSGDVDVARMPGLVEVSGDSGNITGQQLSSSPLKLGMKSGDITVTALSSSVVPAEALSGNLLLRFSKIPSNVVVANKSGDVTLVLPAGTTAYQVHASTHSGSTEIGVRTSASSPHVLTVSTLSGN